MAARLLDPDVLTLSELGKAAQHAKSFGAPQADPDEDTEMFFSPGDGRWRIKVQGHEPEPLSFSLNLASLFSLESAGCIATRDPTTMVRRPARTINLSPLGWLLLKALESEPIASVVTETG
jgi:hypothetical protein